MIEDPVQKQTTLEKLLKQFHVASQLADFFNKKDPETSRSLALKQLYKILQGKT